MLSISNVTTLFELPGYSINSWICTLGNRYSSLAVEVVNIYPSDWFKYRKNDGWLRQKWKNGIQFFDDIQQFGLKEPYIKLSFGISICTINVMDLIIHSSSIGEICSAVLPMNFPININNLCQITDLIAQIDCSELLREPLKELE